MKRIVSLIAILIIATVSISLPALAAECDIEVGDVSEGVEIREITFERNVANKNIIVAIYDEGKLIDAAVAENTTLAEKKLTVGVGKKSAVDTLKCFVMYSNGSLKPFFAEPAVADLTIPVEPEYNVTYQVVGTPHYSSSTNDTWYNNTLDLGYPALLALRVDNDYSFSAPAHAYISADMLGIEADELDKLFLAHIDMNVTLDEDDVIDSINAWSSKMKIKTVTDIKLDTVSSNKADSYYFVDANADGINDSYAKLLSGKASADGETFYFFNAPYEYVRPEYNGMLVEAEKYELRNAENIGEIRIEVDDLEDGTFVAYTNEMVIPSLKADYDASGYYRANALTLAGKYDAIYYDGLYEADLYDVDGDGLYDYLNYKPYRMFRVNSDEKYSFWDYGITGNTYNSVIDEVYTEGATLLGKDFEDGDFVIGYYSRAANTIKIAEVIKPVTSKIRAINRSNLTVTLLDGTIVNVADAWKYVYNFKPVSIQYDVELYENSIDYTNAEYKNLLSVANIGNDSIDFYIYDGVVLYAEGSKVPNFAFSENLIIPTSDANGRQVIEQFDADLGKTLKFIYAWVDGELKWVPVETDTDVVFPEIVEMNVMISPEYYEQLCTYTVDENGIYTVYSLSGNVDPEDQCTYKGINRDPAELLDDENSEIQYILTDLSDVLVKKYVGPRFTILDVDGNNILTYVDGSNGKTYTPRVNFTDDTRIIIKNIKGVGTIEQEVQFIEYDVNSFNTSSSVPLHNVSVLLANDAENTSIENLLLFYGEAYDFDITGGTVSGEEDKETVRPEIGTENLIIPTTDVNGRQTFEQFDAASGKIITYIYAWVDGELKWIPVITDEDAVYPVIAASGVIDPSYFEKLCTYAVNDDGVYTVVSLSGDIDPEDCSTYQGINRDPSVLLDEENGEMMYIATEFNNVLIRKVADTKFELVDAFDGNINILDYFKDNVTYEPCINLTNDTRIIIKNYKYASDADHSDDEIEYLEFDINSFTTSSDCVLNNVSVVLENNPEHTDTENLLVLYAEAYDFDINADTAGGDEDSETARPEIGTEKLLIPTTDVNGRQTFEQFDTASGKMITYIYAWVDSELKWIPVITDEDAVYPVIASSGVIDYSYFEKLCTYAVNDDGVYTVVSLSGDIDPEDCSTYQGINRDPSVLLDEENGEMMYIATGLNGVHIQKVVGTRFELLDSYNDNTNLLSYTDDKGDKITPRINFTDNTKIIIKNIKHAGSSEQVIEFIEYDVNTFIGSADVVINNVSVILENDPDSTSNENLLVLYGEGYDFELKPVSSGDGKDYRIIKSSDPYVDENGYYRNSYCVLNPFTGNVETIAGNKTAVSASGISVTSLPIGSMISLKGGKVNDTLGTMIDVFDGISNTMSLIDNNDAQAGLVWIMDYYESDGAIVVGDVVNSTNWYDIAETCAYTVDEDTVVTLLKHDRAADLVQWGSFRLLTIDDIATPENEMKCYNTRVPTYFPGTTTVDTSKDYKTGYAKYLKAYIVTDNEHNLGDGELNRVKFIMIVANGYENMAHLTTNIKP